MRAAGRGARCDFRVLNLGSDDGEAGFGEWPMRLVSDDAVAMRGARTAPLSVSRSVTTCMAVLLRSSPSTHST